jgi:methionyl-tRNA formyltransferase
MDAPIVFAGTPANAARTLEHLIQGGFKVVLVITRPDAPVGRKREITASAVAEVAAKYSIATVKTNKLDSAAVDAIKQSGATLGVVVAYGSLLRKEALDALDLGWFNLHYSLLPKFRGAAPVQHALLSGETETGVTFFKIDEGMDTGAVVGSLKTEINPDETAGELLARLTKLGCTLLSECIPAISAGVATLSEQTGTPSLAPKISRAEARIDWSKKARSIEALILGCNPEPGAWTELAGESFKVLAARALPDNAGVKPGALEVSGSNVFVGTGEGVLLLKEVQPASKRAMTAIEWARGLSEEMSFD